MIHQRNELKFLLKSAHRSSGFVIFLSCVLMGLLNASSSSSPILLRIRQSDGSIRRVLVSSPPDSTPLSTILLPDELESGCKAVLPATSSDLDISKTLSEMNLVRNGTLIALQPPPLSAEQKDKLKSTTTTKDRFDPYPDLAKRTSYRRAKALISARGSARRSMSYADVEKLQAAMHKVEPEQKSDALKRIYMCVESADRFKTGCQVVNKSKKQGKTKQETNVVNKVGLLLGTVHKERVDKDSIKARTSLSTTTESAKMCDVVKVHAIWEPTAQSSSTNLYNAEKLYSCFDTAKSKRILKVAKQLGLQPVGWIYSYTDNNARQDAEVPTLSRDIWAGAKIQVHMMKHLGREKGAKFVTLAMDSSMGATEGFQLSDGVIQMISEEVLEDTDKEERYFTTQDPVLVDGKETHEVDSVLCLVNTAMLSHIGKFSGKLGNNIIGKGGGLTAKTKSRLLSIIQAAKGGNDNDVFDTLCDFNLLCGLDKIVGKNEMNELIDLVTKYSKGHKRGLKLGQHLRLVLESALA